MGKQFIPSFKPVIFPTSTPSSRPSRQFPEICPTEDLRLRSRLAVLPILRRVLRAWWSSRRSKPLPRHFVSGGGFDSYPLRQNPWNLCVLYLLSAKGGDGACHASKFSS